MADAELQQLLIRLKDSSPLENSRVLQNLLDHLVKNRDDPKNITEAAIQRILFERNAEKPADHRSSEPSNARGACTRLRDALHYYFLYSTEGLRESVRICLPLAEHSDSMNVTSRLYRLEIGPEVTYQLNGAKSFWHPHLVAEQRNFAKNIVVFTEPLCFRDKKNRFFIRHLDINEEDGIDRKSTEEELVARLKEKVPWIETKNIVVSRAYVPGGEVLGKDKIRDWLAKHSEAVRRGVHARQLKEDELLVEERISKDIRSIGEVDGRHLILLGSPRANWLMRRFQDRTKKWMPIHVEENGISVQNSTSAEIRLIEENLADLLSTTDAQHRFKKMVRLTGKTARFSDDWSKVSFALVTREIRIDGEHSLTAISANQGRGIQTLCELVLTKDDAFDNALKRLGVVGPLPDAFQILFAATLKDAESRPDQWSPLLYRTPAHSPHRPLSLLPRVNRPPSEGR